MSRRVSCQMYLILVLALVLMSLPASAADPVGWWKCDEGAGDTVTDSSGRGFDGTLSGDAGWAAGQLGGAIEFSGDGLMSVPGACWNTAWDAKPATEVTFCMWAYTENISQTSVTVRAGPGLNLHIPWGGGIYFDIGSPVSRINLGGASDQWVSKWCHWAFTFTPGDQRIYLNGELFQSGTSTTPNPIATSAGTMQFGRSGAAGQGYFGLMDDIRLYNVVLSQAEIQTVMTGLGNVIANSPMPGAGAVDVLRDVTLAWAASENPGTHTVYFGETLADVEAATADNPLGVLRSLEQLELTYQIAEHLEFAKTYFWRVDEVNATPDKTVFKGPIWKFTTEPYSVEIPGAAIAATASSSSNEFSVPQATIDGSGLGADGTHAIAPETMWFTASADLAPWIQYEFDGIKKLDTMRVWNSNSSAEMAIGWGVKDVQIEYSKDGEHWDVLQDVTQFSRASGLPTYTEYDEIDFNGVAAKQVRLNIQSNWGGLLLSYGLSEVKFSMILAEARTPDPVSGSVDVLPSAVVQWRAGRGAAQHVIYVSPDANAVADGSAPSVTSNTSSLDLASLDLELGETYYWRVDEVNEAEAVSVWAGPVWSLSTSAALTVDDFEGYSNVSPDRPFQHWLDGFGYSSDEFFPAAYGGNGTGSGTGHDIWSLSSPQYQGDIMESVIVVNGSGQSMPIYYDNASGSSQVDRTFTTPQDWTANGVQTLGLSFFGNEANGGQLYLVINGTKVAYDLDAEALKQPEWHFWAIDLEAVGVDLKAVTSMSIGIEGPGSGVVYVDDIALYSSEVQTIEPMLPGTENLAAQYSFEGNYGDSSGQGNTLTEVGDVTIVNDAERGNVAVFNGLNAALQVPVIGDGTTSELTITTWFRLDVEHTGALWSIFHNDGWSAGDVHAHISQNAQFSMGVNGSGSDLRSTTSATVGQWYHLAYVVGPEAVSLYINGVLSQTSAGNPEAVLSLGEGTLGAWSNGAMERFIGGSMDDVRIYTRALSAEEVAGIAGRSTMYKPF